MKVNGIGKYNPVQCIEYPRYNGSDRIRSATSPVSSIKDIQPGSHVEFDECVDAVVEQDSSLPSSGVGLYGDTVEICQGEHPYRKFAYDRSAAFQSNVQQYLAKNDEQTFVSKGERYLQQLRRQAGLQEDDTNLGTLRRSRETSVFC